MEQDTRLTKEQSEELRLYIKESTWALKHLENFYNLTKMNDEPTIEIKNQLKLFDEIN